MVTCIYKNFTIKFYVIVLNFLDMNINIKIKFKNIKTRREKYKW